MADIMNILFALLLLLQELSLYFRVLALGPALLLVAHLVMDVIPVWYTQISYGTVPDVVQWMLWLALFPLWWRVAATVRASIPSAYWMLATGAVSCTLRPWVVEFLADEGVLDFGVFVDDNEPLFRIGGWAIDIPPFWSYPFTAYFLSRVDVGNTAAGARLILEAFAQEISQKAVRWISEVAVALAQNNEWARSSPIGAFPIDSRNVKEGAPLDSSAERPITSQGDEAHTATSYAEGQPGSQSVQGVVLQYDKEINRLTDKVNRLQKELRSQNNQSRGLTKTQRLRVEFGVPGEKPASSPRPELPQTLRGYQKSQQPTELQRSFQISAVKTMSEILPTEAPVYRDQPAQTDEVTIPAVAVAQMTDAHVQTDRVADKPKTTLTVMAAQLVVSVEPEEAPGTPTDLKGAGEGPSLVQSSTQTDDAGHPGPVVFYDSSVVERQRLMARLLNKRARKVRRAAHMVAIQKQKKKPSVEIGIIVNVPPQHPRLYAQELPTLQIAAGADIDVEDDTVLDEPMAESQAEDSAPTFVFASPAAAVSQEYEMEDTKEEEEEAGDYEMAPLAPMEVFTHQELALPAPTPQMAPQQTLPDQGNFFPVFATPAFPASHANTTHPVLAQPPVMMQTRAADPTTTACEPGSVQNPPSQSVIPGIGPDFALQDSADTEMKSSQLGSSKVEGMVAPNLVAIPSEQANTPTTTVATIAAVAAVAAAPPAAPPAAKPRPGPAPASAPARAPPTAAPVKPEGRHVKPLGSRRMTEQQRQEAARAREATEAAGLQSLQPTPAAALFQQTGLSTAFAAPPTPDGQPPFQFQGADDTDANDFYGTEQGGEAEGGEGDGKANDAADGDDDMAGDEDKNEEVGPDKPLDNEKILKHFEYLCEKFLVYCDNDMEFPYCTIDIEHFKDLAADNWLNISQCDWRFETVNPSLAQLQESVNSEFGEGIIDDLLKELAEAGYDSERIEQLRPKWLEKWEDMLKL
ncbi:hypothetical protein F5X68DRAFT_231395 [Plectosphaerella plurivora]|uniref:Uncharacterized protein n=1 Tax=Plectosphaerella plurivora TaxID=936078 RepID=A0A9P9ABE2_9PEZI|nr:hypothetical protein F5X68DRAFT_231395 [Plectosphaerella plurivora]